MKTDDSVYSIKACEYRCFLIKLSEIIFDPRGIPYFSFKIFYYWLPKLVHIVYLLIKCDSLLLEVQKKTQAITNKTFYTNAIYILQDNSFPKYLCLHRWTNPNIRQQNLANSGFSFIRPRKLSISVIEPRRILTELFRRMSVLFRLLNYC